MVDLLADDDLLRLPRAGRPAVQDATDAPARQARPQAGSAPSPAAPPAPSVPSPATPPPTTATPARTAGPCHICKRPAKRACRGCQKPVCAADSWTMFGLCTSCASEDRVQRWNRKAQADTSNWLDR